MADENSLLSRNLVRLRKAMPSAKGSVLEREKDLGRRQNPKVDGLEIIIEWVRVNILTRNIRTLNCIFH